jgi:serine/threonine-protein phosphatase PP1 catalytic subunit
MSTPLDRLLGALETGDKRERDSIIRLNPSDLTWLCGESIKVLKEDPILLRVGAPITVVGDIHGQFYDLLALMKLGGALPDTQYLFLGDYVDRGKNSVEVFAYLLALKIKFPARVWLIRGNHETADVSAEYGLRAECVARYNIDLWTSFCQVFEYLPIAAIIADKIFCVHGGLSPRLYSLDSITSLKRPLEIPSQGMLADLLWADPDKQHSGFRESERGMGYTFGPDVADRFLQKNNFELIIRAHEVVQSGFQYPFDPEKTTLTLFSAPDYNPQLRNKGALAKVDADCKLTFQLLDPPAMLTRGFGSFGGMPPPFGGLPPMPGSSSLPSFGAFRK